MLLALALWHILAVAIDSPIVLVSPLKAGERLLTIWREPGFFRAVAFTMSRVAFGFLIGLAAGILFGMLSAAVPFFETLLWPFVSAAKAVPVAALVVICLIWLSGRNLSVLIVFLVVFPVIYQNVLTGMNVKDRELEEMADLFGMPGWSRFRTIRLPVLAPYLTSACRITVGMAWKAAVAAEVIGTPAGSIGREFFLAKTYLATDDLLAWTVIIVVLGAVTEKIVLWIIERMTGSGAEGGDKNE